MRYARKIFTSLIAIPIAVLTATAALLALPLTRPSAAEAATGAAGLSYDYIMSAPLAVAAEGENVYVLDESGEVSSLSDGAVGKFTGETFTPGEAASADKLAAFGGAVYLYGSDVVAVTSGSAGIYEITENGVALRTDAESSSPLSVGLTGDAVTAAADGDALYIVTESGGRYSLIKWSDGNTETIAVELPADGNVTASAVLDGVFYYATDYTLYSLEQPDGCDTRGGIISMAASGDKLLFTTRSGRVHSYDGSVTETVLGKSGHISVSSRRNTVAFADKGNNRVTVMRDGETTSLPADSPNAAAISYTGEIFTASDNKIVNVSRDAEVFVSEGIVADICFDIKAVDKDIVYALGENGDLTEANGGTAIASSVSAIAPSPEGGVLALGTDGTVTHYAAGDNGGYTAVSSFTAAAGTDIDADRAGNVYVLSGGEISKYSPDGSTSEKLGVSDIDSFEISEVSFAADGYAVGFGDIVTVGLHSRSTDVIPAGNAGTDMLDGEEDKEAYTAFSDEKFNSSPAPSSERADIAVVTTDTEIYPCPAEMPSDAGTITKGTYVTLVARYEDTDYYLAIAESAEEGSAIGYINVNAVERCDYMTEEETIAEYGPDLRRYVYIVSPIYKYPSEEAPVLESSTIDTDSDYNEFTVAPFVKGYKDAKGGSWYRVVWADASDKNVTLDGYMKVSTLSLVSGDQTEPDINGEIRADDGVSAKCYAIVSGEYVENGDFVADRTKVEIVGDYTKSEEYTHIRYKDENGTVRDCYVLTGEVILTEAGRYQIVMFVVAGVVAVFLIVLVTVYLRRRKKID